MNLIEYRINRFRELHNNKWFHIMNFNLDVLRSILYIIHNSKTDPRDIYTLIKYGNVFYY